MKRKIKLRDLTKENLNKMCGENDKCETCPLNCIKCEYFFTCKELYSNKFLNQEVEIETSDILNKQEKKYLKAVIKPFRDRVISISKCFYVLDNAYLIEIYMKSVEGIFNTEYLRSPFFKNEMYKGMETNKKYTLEELDLWNNKQH